MLINLEYTFSHTVLKFPSSITGSEGFNVCGWSAAVLVEEDAVWGSRGVLGGVEVARHVVTRDTLWTRYGVGRPDARGLCEKLRN